VSLHDDLLAQARDLLRRERNRPKQASLRRAVSAAYYALFHNLVSSSSRFLVAGGAQARQRLREAVSRVFAHAEMKAASEAFANAGKSNPRRDHLLNGEKATGWLPGIAAAFVELQQARHEADYDTAKRFTRREASELVELARLACRRLGKIRNSARAKAYLVALCFWNRLKAQ
jgi:uncharacterized protein (UPF0332 family)